MRLFGTPYRSSEMNILLWNILSNAFVQSMKSRWSLLLPCSVYSKMRRRQWIACEVLRLGRNPNWRLRGKWSMTGSILSHIMMANNL